MSRVTPVRDIDGDGIVDIVATESGDYGEDVAWVRGISGAPIGGGADFGEPIFELEVEPNTPSGGGDVDGDGLTDLVLSDYTGCGGLDESCWRLFLGATLGAGGDFVATDADACRRRCANPRRPRPGGVANRRVRELGVEPAGLNPSGCPPFG